MDNLKNHSSILMYHSVGDDRSFLTVTVEVFKKQLQFLCNKKYSVIKLSEFYKEMKPGSVVLTFDDAYENFYRIAWPLLKKYRIPVTVFVPTGLMGKSWKMSDGTVLPVMTEMMIKEISDEGLVEFMPHSETHADLSLLPAEKYDQEIGKSREALEKLLGGNRNILAYPYGKMNGEVQRYLKSNGWIGAAGTSFGLVHEKSDPYNLPRNRVGPETTPALFAQFLCDTNKMEKEEEGKRKKRILVIIPDRFEKSAGGMGAHSGPLFEALSSEYEFYIAAYPLAPGTKAPSFATDYREVTGPFTEVKFGALNVMIAQSQYLAAAISFPKPDLVYAYDWSIYLSAVETAKHFNVPLVTRMCLSAILLSTQGYYFGLDVREPLHKALHNSFCEMEIRGLKKADLIVQISEGYAKMYEKIAPFQGKTRIVPNGIDLTEWKKKEAAPYQLPGKNKYKIIYIGRLVEMKGIVPLCKAEIPKDIDLIFIGDMDRADAVCKEAINTKIKNGSNVFSLGALYGEEKIRALRAADAVIIPSYHEAFGNVGLEALAADCVVLSSRVGGMEDFLTDATSIYCGTKPETIEKAYQTFLNMTEQEKESMRKARIETLTKYTLANSAEALKRVFVEALSPKKDR